MRKDARIGLVLGGVILAFLAVFVMLPSKKSAESNTQAELHEGAPGETVDIVADGGTAKPPVAVDNTDATAGTSHAATDPFAANNLKPTVTPSNEDRTADWASLLDKGLTPVMVTSGDPVPAPRRVADAGPGPGRVAVPPADPLVDLTSAGPVIRTYTVKSGDTLVAISRTEYGTGKYVDLIVKANPEVKDPRKLKIGMVLKIPPLSTTTGSTTKAD